MPTTLTDLCVLLFPKAKSFLWLLFWAPLWALGAYFFMEHWKRK